MNSIFSKTARGAAAESTRSSFRSFWLVVYDVHVVVLVRGGGAAAAARPSLAVAQVAQDRSALVIAQVVAQDRDGARSML
jgi:hypothetical protein